MGLETYTFGNCWLWSSCAPGIHRLLGVVIFICYCCFIHTFDCPGQDTFCDYNWILGNASPSPDDSLGLVLSFANEMRQLDVASRPTGLYLTNASISDSDGQLQLHTNGCAIYNAQNEIIDNGGDLNPGEIREIWCDIGYSVPNGAIFVPLSDSIIGLYHIGLKLVHEPVLVYADRLYETMIHKGSEGYSVEYKNHIVLSDSLEANLEVVKGHNNDWWLVVPRRLSDTYYSMRLSLDGVDTLFSSVLGQSPSVDGGGQTCFSPDGTKYARYNPSNSGVRLFSFDRVTGLLDDYRLITTDSTGLFGGIAFSPNSRYLYVSNILNLYQIDTESIDSNFDATLIDTFDGYSDPFPATFYQMQLGPDCKVYMIPNNGIRVMHVINQPDLPGKDCDFQQHGLRLPVPNSITIPNFPVVRVDQSQPCDTSITTSTVYENLTESQSDIRIKVFPNPSLGDLNIENLSNEPVTLLIYNNLGQVLESGLVIRPGFIETVYLPTGISHFTIIRNGLYSGSGRVMVMGND